MCTAPTTTTRAGATTTTQPSATSTTFASSTTTTTSARPNPPLFGPVAQVAFRGSADVVVALNHSEEFTRVEHYYQCSTQTEAVPFTSSRSELSVSPALSKDSGRWGISVTWKDVVTGSGPGECYGDSVSLYARVDSGSLGWSAWGYVEAPIESAPSNLHPTPVLSDPSVVRIAYNRSTRVVMTVDSTQEFTAWEYKHVCYNSYGDRVVSGTENRWPTFPTDSGLDEYIAWLVRTGGKDNECFSQPRVAFVLLHVRIKSSRTEWSHWAYHRLPIDLAPVAPTFSMVSHDSSMPVAFGETSDVAARVSHVKTFTRIEQYVACRNRAGEAVVDRGGKSSVFTRSFFGTWEWLVTTGDDSGECYHRSSVTLFALVLLPSGWSRWGSTLVPAAKPVCVSDVVDLSVDEQATWFVDCTALHRKDKGTFSGKRYRITLESGQPHYPVAVEVASSTDFVITLVGGTSSTTVATKEGVTRAAGGGTVWYSGRMVEALSVGEVTYVLEISTKDGGEKGTFSIDIEEYVLNPPTDLQANGHSAGEMGQSQVSWNSVLDAKGYEVQYILDCPPKPCSTAFWSSPPLKTNTNSSTLTNLKLDTVYRIVARSILGIFKSDWSEPVYTYTTNDPLALNTETVAGFGFHGYWASKRYSYTLCVDTIPATTTTPQAGGLTKSTTTLDWKTEIINGLAVWQPILSGLVSVSGRQLDCTTVNSVANPVKIATKNDVADLCMRKRAIGCTRSTNIDNAKRKNARIYLSDTLTKELEDCSRLFQIAAHEAGHALGFDAKHTHLEDLLMYSEPATACLPGGYEIAAIKALYQSRE